MDVRPDDLQSLTLPGSVSVQGDLVLVNVATPDLTANAYRGGLYRVPLDGSGAQRWTWAERDLAPRVSPDGRWVAFLRCADKGGKPQLHVMPATGGDARRLTDLPLGAGAPVWSPDSAKLAFVTRVPEAGRYGVPIADGEEPWGPESEAPRHIARLDYRYDDIGFVGDRNPRLFTVDVLDPEAKPVELTDGTFTVAEPAWTADGSALLFVADRDLGAVETLHQDVYRVPAGGGEPELYVRSKGMVAHPVAAGDGIVFYGSEFTGVHSVARNNSLWRYSGGELTRVTELEGVDCERAAGAPVVTDAGVLVAVRNRGAVELRRVPLDGVEVPLDGMELLAGEQAEVKSFAADGDVVVAVVSRADNTGEVVRVGGGELTSFGSSVPLRPVVELTGSASDGYPVHGWLVLPDGEGPHPVLLVVHGGPFMYHGWGFFDEAQVYAAAGYAVVLPNPRGSAGYGQAHGQAVVGGFGTVDVDDVLSVLDVALERPDLDADRVGVMGGSYGGFMTSWLAAHHGERFRAAWSERAVNAWDSFSGSSDIGWFFTEAYCGSSLETQRAMSPLTYAEKVSIPFMVVHSEHDWRCPLEQAQRQFVALRRNGVEAEMLLFPGEGHELTRSGQPRHRKQRFDHVLAWWARHLS
ncbi:Dipeptidyl-peptidase 5 [Actinosynnema sp. ALI-1.44]